MKVIIIDDEALAREHVKECLQKHPEMELLAECDDGLKGIKAIQEHKPDLIFLDIQMPRINGFEMLELLEEPPQVIFTTAFDEFALKAFEVNAIDYLLKPFGQDRFDKALGKINKSESPLSSLGNYAGKSPEEAHRVVVKHQGEIRIIPTQDLMYLEAWDDYVKLHAAQNVFVKKNTLTFYENSLNSAEFVRCHRSFIVNIREITSIEHSGNDSWEVRLKNGFHLPASRQGYLKLKQVMGI